MNCHFKWVAGISVATLSTLLVDSGAIAQEVRPEVRQKVDAEIFRLVRTNLDEQMEEVFYTNDQPYYTNRGMPRQISSFVGISFVENEINDDAQLIHDFATLMWEEQAASGPVIRTPDLPNPFQSSLLLEPTIAEQEFPSTFVRQPIGAQPTVSRPSSVTRQPVPALW